METYKNDLIIDVEKRERKVTLPEPIQEEKMKPSGQHQEQMMPVKVEDQTTGFRFVRKVTLPEPIQEEKIQATNAARSTPGANDAR